MSQDDPPPPLSENVVKLLSALAHEFERMLTPIVDASFDGVAEVAFAQGEMGAYSVREAVVPPSTGHHLHVCLNVLQDSLRGTVTVEMLNAAGTVLRTERAEVDLPQGPARTPRRRPRPLGVISLLFPVHADVDWGAVVSARLWWSPRSSG